MREGSAAKTSKTLSAIVVWVLFLFGLLRLIIGLVMAFSSGANLPASPVYFDLGLGVISLFLSVVVMKIRKSLD